MTSLTIEQLILPAAELGPDNPLPPLVRDPRVNKPLEIDASVPSEYAASIGYGVGSDYADPALPYTMQDSYSRNRSERPFKVAVLENDYIRATFLMEHGARLYSLFHKGEQRELLYVNPIFQPANLAIRNAWFSGGVEWNCGVRGHTPLGCDPVFFASVRHADGWPTLRAWEYERIRGVAYQLDFILPPDAQWLFVNVMVHNMRKETIPMYWWSNIAVPQTSNGRVVAPAVHALSRAYDGGLTLIDVPLNDGRDMSLPEKYPHSQDVFFVIPDGSRPWIASLDGEGKGLVHTSTDVLKGRKLFAWGNHHGGEHWQRYLSKGNDRYLEIQAGVARTQYESFPMAPGSTSEWMEAYGYVDHRSTSSPGGGWPEGVRGIEEFIDRTLSEQTLETLFDSLRSHCQKEPSEVLQAGSGWGALEELRRKKAGEQSLVPHAGCPFANSTLGVEQQPWVSLLVTGILPGTEDPQAWMVQKEWIVLLEACQETNWLSWLHMGVMQYHEGRLVEAETSWRQSLRLRLHSITLRNMAILSARIGKKDEAGVWIEEARKLDPECVQLLVEWSDLTLRADHPQVVMDVLGKLPKQLIENGRLRALYASAATESGEYEMADLLLAADLIVPDIREGEIFLSEAWFELTARKIAKARGVAISDELRAEARRRPLPQHLDFRNNEKKVLDVASTMQRSQPQDSRASEQERLELQGVVPILG